MMNPHISPQIVRAIVVIGSAALAVLSTASFAQPTVPAAPVAPATPATKSAAPDGAPSLPKETTINQKSATASSDSVVRGEERVQGRLASARVGSGAGSSYQIVDPSAGQTDRAATNSGKRVAPSQWELFRF